MRKEDDISRRIFLKTMLYAGAGVAAGPLAALASEAAFAGISEKQDTNIGKIIRIRGKAAVNGAEVKDGAQIFEGDELKLDAKSECFVLFDDSAMCRFKPGTSATLNRPTAGDEKKAAVGIDVALLAGGALVHTKKLIKDETYAFTIKTPTSTAGVRGTTFYVEVFNPETTYNCACYGKVYVTPLANPELTKEVETKKHTAYQVSGSGKTEKELFKSAALINHTDEDILELKKMLKKQTGLDSEFVPYQGDGY